MSTKAASFIVLAATLVGFMFGSAAQAADQCSLAPITESLTVPGSHPGEIIPDKLSMAFVSGTFDEVIGGTTVSTAVIRPNLRLRADMTSYLREKMSEIETDVRSEVDKNKLDFGGMYVTGNYPQGNKLVITANVNVKKFVKYDWVCCKWFKCRKCRKEIRLFEKTIPLNIEIKRTLGPSGGSVYTRPIVNTGNQLVAVTAAAEYPVKMDVDAVGAADASLSDLEKVFDFIVGVFEGIANIFGGDNKWQFKDWVSQNFSRNLEGPNPYLFQQQMYTFAHQKKESADKTAISQRWFWQSFVAGLRLNESETGFFFEEGANKFVSTFDLDYDKYSKYINNTGFGETGFVVDFLAKKVFCIREARELLEEFVKGVKNAYEKKQPPPIETVAPKKDVAEVLASHYGVWGLDELARSSGGISSGPTPSEVKISLPSFESIAASATITPILGNLWAMAKEQDWSKEELACAERLARKRSGSKDLIYPSQSFDECLEESGFSKGQILALDRVIADPESFSPSAVSTFGPPILGSSNYRGWYYCYTTTTLCVGKDRIIWSQRESVFGARGGRHKGVDIYDGAGDDADIPLVAVAKGKLTYNNLDPGGWGHALILPFSKDGKSYMAVYAHLPASAKNFDGKSVNPGDSIGQAACSGNAGDGKGNCNNYCFVNGGNRTDIHLHFEIIEVDPAGTKTKVDPVGILPNFSPQSNSDIKLYTCAPPKVANVQ